MAYGIQLRTFKVLTYTKRRSQPIGHNQNLKGTFYYWNVNQENGKRVSHTSKVFTMPERYNLTTKSGMVKYTSLKMQEI